MIVLAVAAFFTAFAAVAASAAAPLLPYMNPALDPQQRAKDLVSRLSLEDQVGLLLSSSARSGGVAAANITGCVADGSCDNITDYKWWTECNSGIEVEYPQNVNIAATFNRSVAFQAGRGTGIGLRKRADAQVQDLSCWSPMTNIMRHPLWGRGHEGYGEDPYLAGEMVYQNVLGVQGFGLEGFPKYSLANTGCKHFSTFNGPMNWGTAVISDYDWFLNYLPQFERCLDAGSYSVMCSYASLNGVSGCADRRAMQTVLRETWGAKWKGGSWPGFVVSDCGAVASSPAGAIASLEAGTDLECNPWGQGVYPTLVNSSKAGNVSTAAIAQAAERLLYVRFRLGAFDKDVPFADKTKYGKHVDMGQYEKIALEAAQQSMVLLKNDGILPINPKNNTTYKRIAAVGIMNCMSAGYDTGFQPTQGARKILTDEALAAALPDSTITSGAGCRCPLGTGINNEGCEGCPTCQWAPTGGMAMCSNYDEPNVAAAVAGADLVVLHLGFGGKPGEQTDLTCDRAHGTACDLARYANQTAMLETVLATKIPLILVLFTTLPMHITDLVANAGVRAIVQAYYPQHVGGQAVADVITGRVNPAGRLISTWPKQYDESLSGKISNYTMIGTKKTYRFGYPDPLFPFGYGLSFTSWQYSSLHISTASVQPCENVTVTVTVRNTGATDGSEVVQLYAEWADVDAPTATVTLVNFDRVFVRAGQAVTVTLIVDPRHYAVLQKQPLGPPTKTEPKGAWVPPAWIMKQATVKLSIGGQQPYSTPRLPSNVLTGSFKVAGDGTAVTRCPKWEAYL